MSTKWSHLPNAHLIDWVLKSLKTDPNAWDAAWDAWYAVGEAERAARFAILALIADDNAAQYLHMESDKLKVWAILSEKPAAVLLIPANQIWQQEHARAIA